MRSHRLGFARLAASIAAALCSLAPMAKADILFEDIMYWRPGGITELNPPVPPTDAYVKIQETVYDDAQGRASLTQLLALGLINGNGGVVPATPINLYAYTITNLNYDNGPFTGAGLGVGGFTIPNPANVPFIIYAPNFANSRWHGHVAGPNFNWQIDGDGDLLDGDGIGILRSQTHNSINFVVPAGTAHGFIQNATINTWSGAGTLEEPIAQKIDFITGFVSGPIPEPSAAMLVVGGSISVILRRRRD